MATTIYVNSTWTNEAAFNADTAKPEGLVWGKTAFSNYQGAYNYASVNDSSATISIESTNTLSGNTFDNNHKNKSKLAVVIKDGASLGDALSKWDMTYAVTVEAGGKIEMARPKSASVSNIHIKNTLTIGEAGEGKKTAYLDLLSDSYQDGDISIRYNGKIVANNAVIDVQDLDAQGKMTLTNTTLNVDGALATTSSAFYKNVFTNCTINVAGTQITGGLSDFSGGDSNQLGSLDIIDTTITFKAGAAVKVAGDVTMTGTSTLDVDALTINKNKKITMDSSSKLIVGSLAGDGTIIVNLVEGFKNGDVVVDFKNNDATAEDLAKISFKTADGKNYTAMLNNGDIVCSEVFIPENNVLDLSDSTAGSEDQIIKAETITTGDSTEPLQLKAQVIGDDISLENNKKLSITGSVEAYGDIEITNAASSVLDGGDDDTGAKITASGTITMNNDGHAVVDMDAKNIIIANNSVNTLKGTIGSADTESIVITADEIEVDGVVTSGQGGIEDATVTAKKISVADQVVSSSTFNGDTDILDTAIADSTFGTVMAYGENSVSGTTSISSLRMGYKAEKADDASVTITGKFNGNFIVGWGDGHADSKYVLNIGDADGDRTTVGKEAESGNILNIHGANGSANIVNTDFYLHQLRAKGDVSFTDSKLYLKNVDQAIFATVSLNNTVWDAENNFNSYVAIGSDSYKGNAVSNAELNLTNNSIINAYNLGLNNASGDFSASMSADNSSIMVQNELYIGTGASLSIVDSTLDSEIVTNSGTVKVSGESTLNISKVAAGSNDIELSEGAILKDSTIMGDVGVTGNVIFRGKNVLNNIYDFGEYDAYGSGNWAKWTVEAGSQLFLEQTVTGLGNNLYGVGYGDTVVINGNLTDAAAAREAGLTKDDASFYSKTGVRFSSAAGYATSSFTVNNAYVILGTEGSFSNSAKNGGSHNITFNTAVVDAAQFFFSDSTATFDLKINDSDVNVVIFMTGDKNSVYSLTNSKVVTTGSGNDRYNGNDGALTITNSEITIKQGSYKNTGTITIDETSKLIVPTLENTGTITVDVTDNWKGVATVIDAADGTADFGKIELADEGLNTLVDAENGDLIVYNVDTNALYVNSEWANKGLGEEVADGKYFGINAFANMDDAVNALKDNNTTIVMLSDATMTADPGFKLNVISGDGNKHTLKVDSVIDVDAEFAKEIDIDSALFCAYYNNHTIVVNGDLKGGFYNYTGSLTFNNSKITDSYDNSNIGGVVNINGDGSWTMENAQADNLKFINVGRSDWLGQGILNLKDTVVKAIQFNIDSSSAEAKSQINAVNSTIATVLNDGIQGNLAVGANGEVNLTNSNLIVAGALTNNGKISATGDTTVKANLTGNGIILDDATLSADSNIGGSAATKVYGTSVIKGTVGTVHANWAGVKENDTYTGYTTDKVALTLDGATTGNVYVGSDTEGYGAELTVSGGSTVGGIYCRVYGSANITGSDNVISYINAKGSITVEDAKDTEITAMVATGGTINIIDSDIDIAIGTSNNIQLDEGTTMEISGSTVDIQQLSIDATSALELTKTTFTVTGVYGSDLITNNGSITIDGFSTLTADVISMGDNATITIDADGFSGTKKVIDLAGTSSLEGKVTLVNGEGITAIYGEDGDVTITDATKDTLYVNAAWADKKAGDVVGDGLIYGLNAVSTLGEVGNMIATDGSDTTIKFESDITSGSVLFNYGAGDITFTADEKVTISTSTPGITDWDFVVGDVAPTITIGENVTFDISNNESGIYFYYGANLNVEGAITGGENWGCTYLAFGEHNVASTGTISTGRVHMNWTELTVNGDAESDRTAAHIDTNYLLVEESTFTANNAIIDAGAVHDSNNGGLRYGASEFNINNSKFTANAVTLKHADTEFTVTGESSLNIGTLTGAILVDNADLTDSSINKGTVNFKGENSYSGDFNATLAYVGAWTDYNYEFDGSVDFGTDSNVNVGGQMIIGRHYGNIGDSNVVFGDVTGETVTDKVFKAADVSLRRDGTLTIANTTGDNKINTMNVMGQLVIDNAKLSGEVQIGDKEDYNAEMTVKNGAEVTLGGSSNSVVILGKGEKGTLNVDDASVTVKRAGAGAGYKVPDDTFVIGYEGGKGTLNVSNNGTFTAADYNGDTDGGKMNVELNSGSVINASTGGLVDVAGTLYNAGDVNVDGGKLTAGTVANGAYIEVTGLTAGAAREITVSLVPEGETTGTTVTISVAQNATSAKLWNTSLADGVYNVTVIDGTSVTAGAQLTIEKGTFDVTGESTINIGTLSGTYVRFENATLVGESNIGGNIRTFEDFALEGTLTVKQTNMYGTSVVKDGAVFNGSTTIVGVGGEFTLENGGTINSRFFNVAGGTADIYGDINLLHSDPRQKLLQIHEGSVANILEGGVITIDGHHGWVKDGGTLNIYGGTLNIVPWERYVNDPQRDGKLINEGIVNMTVDGTISAGAISFTETAVINITIDTADLTESVYSLINITGNGDLDTAKVNITIGETTDTLANWMGEGTVKQLGNDYYLVQSGNDLAIFNTSPETIYVSSAYAGKEMYDVVNGNIIGINAFGSLSAAMDAKTANTTEIVIESDISDAISGKTISGNLVADSDVTITDSANSNYVNFTGVTLDEDITVDAKYFYLYGENTFNGDVKSSATFYSSGKLTLTGNAEVSLTMSRYYASLEDGIYVVGTAAAGEGKNAAVQYKGINYLGHYSGTFSVKDTAAEFGYILLNGSNDGAIQAQLVLDNAKVSTIGGPNTQPGQVLMDDDAAIIATNDSVLDFRGPKNFGYLSMGENNSISLTDSTLYLGREGQGGNTLNGTVTMVNSDVVTDGTLNNGGTFNATDGSTVTAGAVTNTGVFSADGATLNVGTFTHNGTSSVILNNVDLDVTNFVNNEKNAGYYAVIGGTSKVQIDNLSEDRLHFADGTVLKDGTSIKGTTSTRSLGDITFGETENDVIHVDSFANNGTSAYDGTITVNGTLTISENVASKESATYWLGINGSNSGTILTSDSVGVINSYGFWNIFQYGSITLEEGVTVNVLDAKSRDLRFTLTDMTIKGQIHQIGSNNKLTALQSANVTITGENAALTVDDYLMVGYSTYKYSNDDSVAYQSSIKVEDGANMEVGGTVFVNLASTITVTDATFIAGSVQFAGNDSNMNRGVFTVGGTSTVKIANGFNNGIFFAEAGAALTDDSSITVGGDAKAYGDLSFYWNDLSTADGKYLMVDGDLAINGVEMPSGDEVVFAYAGGVSVVGDISINGSTVVDNTIVVGGVKYDVVNDIDNGISVSVSDVQEVIPVSFTVNSITQGESDYSFTFDITADGGNGDYIYNVIAKDVYGNEIYGNFDNGVFTFADPAKSTPASFTVTVSDTYGASTAVSQTIVKDVNDITAPVWVGEVSDTVITGENGLYNVVDVHFEATDNFAVVGFIVTVNGEEFALLGTEHDYFYSTDVTGTYTYTVTAFDAAGNTITSEEKSVDLYAGMKYDFSGITQSDDNLYNFTVNADVTNGFGDYTYVITSVKNAAGEDVAFTSNGLSFTLSEVLKDESLTVTVKVTDAKQNEITFEGTATVVDKDAPVITVDPIDEAFTNKDVVVKASVTDNFGAENVTFQYKIGNGEWTAYNAETGVVMTANGEITFKATDEAGNVTEEIVNINTIDKDAPVVEITGNADAWTNENVTLNVAVGEDVSTITAIEYQIGEDGEWLAVTDGQIVVEANATVNVKVTDGAGNITEQTIIVDKIDKDAPAVEISGNADVWTNENVTLTVAVGEDVSGTTIEYQIGEDGEWLVSTDGQIVVESNATVNVKVTDGAGNIVTDTIIVDKIDKDDPVVEITGNAAEWTKENVTLSVAVAEDPSGTTIEYQIGEDGEWLVSADGNIVVESNATVNVKVTDGAGNKTTDTIVVDKIDKDAPAVEVSGNADAWTNKNVTLTVAVGEDVSTITAIEYQIGEDGEWLAVTDGQIVVEANATVNVKVTDGAGNITEQTIIVDKIDKDAPAIEVSGNAADWTSENVTLSVAVAEDPSGTTIEYQIGENGEWLVSTDGQIVVESNATVNVKVTDGAGNKTTDTIVVDKIDKAKPNIIVEADPSEVTNSDVIVTITASDDVSGIASTKYSFNGTDWFDYTDAIVVKENTVIYIEVTDNAGKVAEEIVNVSNIDKVAPDAPVASADITELTNETVTVTATFADDVVVKEYSLNGTDWFAYTDGVEMRENGTVYFRGYDAAGNVSSTSEYIVSNIDTTSDNADTTYIFISAGYTAENTVGKSVNGIELVYGENAFASIDDAQNELTDLDNVKFVLVENKTSLSGADDLTGVEAITSVTSTTTVKEGSYKSSINSKGTIAISGADAADTDIHNFKNVSVNMNAVVDSIDGGKATTTETEKSKVAANGTVTVSGSYKFSDAPTGKITIANATVNEVVNYSTINIDMDANVGHVRNESITIADSFKNSTATGKVERSVTLSSTNKAVGTINVAGKSTVVDSVEGFATVNVTDSNVGDIVRSINGAPCGSAKEVLKVTTGKDGVVTATLEESFSASRSGKLTVRSVDNKASVGAVSGYNTVTLDGGNADSIANDALAKRSAKYQQSWENADAYGSFSDYELNFDITAATLISSLDQYSASGSVTLKNGASAGDIANYSKVTATGSGVIGDITALDVEGIETVAGAIKKQTNVDLKKNTVTETETISSGASVKLDGYTAGSISGYKSVTLKNAAVESVDFGVAGSVKTVTTYDAEGNEVESTVTKSFTRNGSLTATDATVNGNISNYNTVKLIGTAVGGDIVNSTIAKELISTVNGEETIVPTETLSGTVTLTDTSVAGTIKDYSAVTFKGGEVESVSNVAKVTVSSGDNTIGSFTGSAEADSFTVAKGATMVLGSADFGNGKDKLTVSGTLILTSAAISNLETITGKGEIAAAADIFADVEALVGTGFKGTLVNLGATAEGFRGTAFELADNVEKKAVAWDASEAFTGWIGASEGCTDNVDFITFTADEDGMLSIGGEFDSITLNGNAIDLATVSGGIALEAGMEYTLKLERNSDSISYTLALA